MNNFTKDAFTYINEHKTQVLKIWEELVNTESGPDSKEGIDVIINRISSLLSDEAAMKCSIIEAENAGNSLIASTNNVDAAEIAPVAFIGHVDTVFPAGTLAKRPFTISDGIITGPGCLDMKGGVAGIIYILKALRHSGFEKFPIKIFLAGDEETAHMKSNVADVLVEELKGCRAVFNLETGFLDNSLVVGRKGAMIVNIEVSGIAAHTGNAPEKGRSAISELINKLILIDKLNSLQDGLLVNIGMVSGGTGANTFADSASASIGIRYSKVVQKEQVLKEIDEICKKIFVDGTASTWVEKGGFAPMEAVEENYVLFNKIKETAEQLGQEPPKPVVIGGASDSSYAVIAGVPAVCALGPKGEGNHSAGEYAVADSLFERMKLIIATIMNL